MLRFSAFGFRPRQHIIPPHAKYVVISAIIIFAVVSPYIPAFKVLYEKSNYRDHKIVVPKKVEAVSIKSNTIKQKTFIHITSSKNSSVVATKLTPTPSPSKKQAITAPSAKPTEKPKQLNPTNTPMPTATPAPTQQAQNSASPNDARGQLFSALNAYRQKKGKPSLSWDNTLAGFAQGRAEQFDREGKMDDHAVFRDLINNDGFNRMGFMSLAENSSYGDTRDPVFIIETLYGQSPGHEVNQMNSEYTHVGVGTSGKATDFIYGGRKK